MKINEVCLSKAALENFTGRFFLLVDQSGDGCWPWIGPKHSSGRGRYLWRVKDGGGGKYVLSHRVSYYLCTGELPKYLRNLCGNRLCCRPAHFWMKPEGRWKPKPKKAVRGRVRQLPASEIQRIRLLATLSHNEEEIGKEFGLTKRQVAEIAMGRVRPEVGGRIRPPRFQGIRFYHDEFERSLLEMRPDVVAEPTPHPVPPPKTSSSERPFPHRSYGQPFHRRLPRTGRF